MARPKSSNSSAISALMVHVAREHDGAVIVTLADV
jgi:hypothetical protein